MKTVIVNSASDPAGSNITKRLAERNHFKETNRQYDGFSVFSKGDLEIVTSKKEIVYVDDLDAFYSDCRYVFVSKHRSDSGIPSLTAHFTGNFGEAKFGGNPNEVARYSPSLLKSYFRKLVSEKKRAEDYQITLEATHHGPTSLKRPVLFIELGSTPKQWADKDASAFVSDTLINSIENESFSKCAIALGGTHYPDKFNKFLVDSEMCLGHIVPKHNLRYLNESMLRQILEKSDQPVKWAVIDSKGLGKEKGRVLDLVSRAGLELIKL